MGISNEARTNERQTNVNSYFPLEVPDYRFDQRNEMFKRRTWDEAIPPFVGLLRSTK